jgi:hypothetical protein
MKTDELLVRPGTDWAPWYAIPADSKWFVRTAIANIVVAMLAALGLKYPRLTGEGGKASNSFAGSSNRSSATTARGRAPFPACRVRDSKCIRTG